MLGQLVPCGGGPPIPLLKPSLLVGRHNYCDIPLRLGTISGRHCELEMIDGYWYVRDLASSNGTQVNGVICSAQRLMPGDVLSLAKFRYKIEYTLPKGAAAVTAPSKSVPPPLPAKAAPPAVPARAAPVPPPKLAPAAAGEGAAGHALGELLPCGGGAPIPLLKPQVVVGRKEGCDVLLPLAPISGRHCQLDWTGGQWYVRDLGSRNGIRVDGVRCESKCLPPGSILSVAGLRFKVVYPGPKPAAGRQSPFGQGLLARAGLTGQEVGPEEEDEATTRLTLEDDE